MGVMAKAIWEGAILAESNQSVEVEGNQYFPPDAIKAEHFKPSATHTVCPWKGTASYYDVVVGGVSLVAKYRTEFATVVRSSGIDGLIKDLQTKNRTLEQKK